MNNPKIILADEPTASLDADRATKVVEMIRQQIKEQQMIGIMITPMIEDYLNMQIE